MNSTEETCTPNLTVLNLTDDETLYDSIYTPMEWYIYMIVYPCILIFGITTNLSFLFVVIRVPYMHNITNFYLCNLAIADLLYVVVTVVGQMTQYLRSPLRFAMNSVLLCILQPYVFIFSFAASTHLVGLVTLERYIAVCHPIKHYLVKGWKRTLKLTVLIWIFAAVSSFSTFLYYNGGLLSICVVWPDDDDYLKYPKTNKVCRINTENEDIQTILFIIWLAVWLLEFIANFAMYFRILRHLHRRSNPETVANNQNALETRNQVAFMLVVNGAVFFFCCCVALVNVIVILIAALSTLKSQAISTFHLFFSIIFLINSSINPIIYNVTNKDYRRAFYLAFTKRNI